MKLNEKTWIVGQNVVLVPYKAHHVSKYHSWMQNKELQILTASEPLTLEKEYNMQQSWQKDEDKLTFIVLDAKSFKDSRQEFQDEIESMIGDVNMFLSEGDRSTAELEIMIAESSHQGKGCGKEAVLAIMKYGLDKLQIRKYSVKIGFSNEKSLNMFHKLGFRQTSRSEVFQEITLELPVTEDFQSEISRLTRHLSQRELS